MDALLDLEPVQGIPHVGLRLLRDMTSHQSTERQQAESRTSISVGDQH